MSFLKFKFKTAADASLIALLKYSYPIRYVFLGEKGGRIGRTSIKINAFCFPGS